MSGGTVRTSLPVINNRSGSRGSSRESVRDNGTSSSARSFKSVGTALKRPITSAGAADNTQNLDSASNTNTGNSVSGVVPASNMAGREYFSNSDSTIRVFPDEVIFRDVQTKTKYQVYVVIQNVSHHVKRIRIVPPALREFNIINVNTQGIAPGLEHTFIVEFQAETEKSFHDLLIVQTDTDRIEIPIHAYFPCPDLHMDSVLDMGVVVPQHTVTKYIKIDNLGKRPGSFSFDTDDNVPITIVPKEGVVQPETSEIIKVELFGSDQIGVTRHVIKVNLEGQPSSRHLDITAKIVESRVELVMPNGGGIVKDISFGSLYYGQKRVVTALLVNSSPFVSSFAIGTPGHNEEGSEASYSNEKSAITTTPSEGELGPFGQIPIQFTFAPTYKEKVRGFKSNEKKPNEEFEEFREDFVIEIVETEQRIDLTVTGKALQTYVTLSEKIFRFGECKVYEHNDMMFTIKNENDELPIDFNINRVAHFHATPSKGRLLPLQSQNIIVTFAPNQIGEFQNKLLLTVGQQLKTFQLYVSGFSETLGEKKKMIGGPNAVKEDFQPKLNFVRPTRFKPRSRLGTRSQTPVSASATSHEEEELDDSYDIASETPLDMLNEWKRKRENQAFYNDFVKSMRMQRQEKLKLRTLEKVREYQNMIDLGMEPGSGLDSPVPELPNREDPLWLQSQIETETEVTGRMRPRKTHKFDENKLIKKKFKPVPTTPNEIRDCKTQLTPKEILNIMAGPKILDFKKVSVYSKNVKSFCVSNDLKTHVLVQIPTVRDELKNSFPESQVIPPNSVAGFDITFSSDTVQTFQQAIYFTVNEHHKLKFVVFAEVVPIEVQLSREEIHFRFNEFNLDSSLSETLTLTNTGNSRAEFQWDIDESKTFTFKPDRGVIEPFKTVTITVVYVPGAVNRSDATFALKVKGAAADKHLRCIGEVKETKCAFVEKKIDFGVVPVGLVKQKSVVIKNNGENSAVFTIDQNLLQGFTVTPTKGRIGMKSSQKLTVELKPQAPQIFDTVLQVDIRGSKSLRIPIKAEAKIPLVELVCDKTLDFGDIFVGSSDRKKITIRNIGGNIPAILYLDLVQFADFAVAKENGELVQANTEEEEEPIVIMPPEPSQSAGNENDEDEEDEDLSDEDDNSEDGERGERYKITVVPDKDLVFYLVFTPTQVSQYDFPLSLSLAGIPTSMSTLSRRVTASALKPRLVASHYVVDFKSKVICREGTNMMPHRLLMTLTNEDDNELAWEYDKTVNEKLPKVFKLEPTSGKLLPGHTAQVQIFFTPRDVVHYQMKVPIYLDGNLSASYIDIEIKGTGAYPMLSFDRKEVVLPVVPLGIKSVELFHVINEGYDNLELKYKLPADTSRVPLSLSFPEGTMLGRNKLQLPVEVSFTSKKPMSFTAKIDFYDADGNRFSIPVTGTADNCLFTTFPFIAANQDTYKLAAPEPGKPIMLVEKDKSSGDHEKNKSPRHSSFSTRYSVSSGVTCFTSTSSHAGRLDKINRKIFNRKSADKLRHWFNFNVLENPVEDLVASCMNSNGGIVYEIIQSLSGKQPPGKIDKMSNNKRESCQQFVTQYEEMLTFLKSYGALLNTVKPEFMLKYEDYIRLLVLAEQPAIKDAANRNNNPPAPNPAAPAAGASASGATVTDTTTTSLSATSPQPPPKRMSERRFLFKATEAWMTILYQVIKIFVLNRISVKKFKSLPGIPKELTVQDPALTSSNIYSAPENVILKWLTYHYYKVYPPVISQPSSAKKKKDQAADGSPDVNGNDSETTTNNNNNNNSLSLPLDSNRSTNSGSGAQSNAPILEPRLISFDRDLHDGRVFAAVLQSHIPTLRKRFETLRMELNDKEDIDHNLSLVIAAMKDVGLDYIISAKDIAENNPRDMLLFCIYLYQNLPQYIPKTVIEFESNLHEKATQHIELSNPTKYPIEYNVLLEGADEFTIEHDKVSLPPKGTFSFPISVVPRFSKSVEARLTFSSQRVGSYQASTMVFNLQTKVKKDKAYKVFEVESSVYEPKVLEIEMDNPFSTNGHFHVTLTQDKPKEVDRLKMPLPFWCPTDHLVLRKNSDGKKQPTIAVQFLPFMKGKFSCRLLFIDENVGEFVYEIHGKANLPVVLDKQEVMCESNSFAVKDIFVTLKNPALERALALAKDRLKYLKIRRATSPVPEIKEITYKVEYQSPFFTGPTKLHIKEAEETDEKGKNKKQDGSMLSVNFKPESPGIYPCKIILTSNVDIRVIEISGKARSPGTKAELEFVVPARQSIQQDIPITNKMLQNAAAAAAAGGKGSAWTISATLTGEYFSGPSELKVPAGKTKNYPLVFSPTCMCDVQGELILQNPDTLEKYIYTLRGIGEAPLAEDRITINCQARQRVEYKLKVPNIIPNENVEYTVESDIPFVSGDNTITVRKGTYSEYVLGLNPQLGGTYVGSVSFTAANGEYLWYVLEINASRPPAESVIDIRSKVRQAVAAEIGITNPLSVPVQFEVMLKGEGLLGDSTISLEPNETSTYSLIYSPLQKGDYEGSISFFNADVGEFWYKLNLSAEPQQPVHLPDMRCEIGKRTTQTVTIENPIGEHIILEVLSNNTRNFIVHPASIAIAPYESTDVTIEYLPSSISKQEPVELKFSNPRAGEWIYRCTGIGEPPTAMESVQVITPIGRSHSEVITFRNPFPVAKKVVVRLLNEENNVFGLMLKRQQTSIAPFANLQIPFSFTPTKITEYKATVVVQLMGEDLQWVFPVRGIAEAARSEQIFKFTCKSRETLTQSMDVELVLPPGEELLDLEEAFTHEIKIAENDRFRKAISRALTITRLNTRNKSERVFSSDNSVSGSGSVIEGQQQQLQLQPQETSRSSTTSARHANRTILATFQVQFAPLRPFNSSVELVIHKVTGGMYRFEIQLEATPPNIDDVIVVESAISRTESVSFRLTNIFASEAQYDAYFTPDSPVDFTVIPAKGVLAPFGYEGTQFIVSYTANNYGKTVIGTMVIETDEMQWRYEVRGMLPKYLAPSKVTSKVDNKLSEDVRKTMMQAKQTKNYLQQNIKRDFKK